MNILYVCSERGQEHMSNWQEQTPQWPPQQPFQQPPDGQQQSFYTQPTQAGQFQQTPYNGIPPQQKRQGLWRWYKTRTRKIKLSIGCGIILAVLLTFSCIGSAIGIGNLASTPTPTATTSHAAAVIQSPAVTQVPSPTPRPTQKPAPTPTAKPTIAPTHAPQPTQPPATPTPCPGVNCNPWGYNFVSPGNYIYSPPAAFCSYFSCISNFPNGKGYVVECQDNMYSKSGGIQGACSTHGGVLRPLYSH